MDQQHQQQPRYSSSTNDDRQLIFLPYDKWSPRYESQFYTLRMERYYIIRDPSDWPASTTSGTTTTTTSDDDDENEDANSTTITCQFCSRRRGGGGGGCAGGAMNKKKKKYPAVYYEIEIIRGSGGGGAAADGNNNNNNNSSSTAATSIDAATTASKKIYRRYSQFDALLRRVDPRGTKKYIFPPKTYMLDSWRSTDVLDERMVGLYDFLCNIILSQQQLEYGNNSNVDGGGGNGGVNSSRCIIGNFLEIL
jgi:hypothetical protein